MIKVNLKEAERHLGQLMEEAAAGEEVIIINTDGPSVRLVLVPNVTVGEESPKLVGNSLDRFIGTWSAEQEAEILKAVEVFEHVDESFWQ
jgi:antitoxin (DNA-binding transcriptional repressor) of toxin-antitoxin stability system